MNEKTAGSSAGKQQPYCFKTRLHLDSISAYFTRAHIQTLYAHANKYINKRDRWEKGEGGKPEIIITSSRKVAYFTSTGNTHRN